MDIVQDLIIESSIYSEKSKAIFLLLLQTTTGVTQLLDQSPNQNLHHDYNKKRDDLFPSFQTINHEGFMTILGCMWDKWATEDTIINAAKWVGISKDGLNINNIQEDKF